MSYERTNISRLQAYTPGEQPQRTPGRRVIKLNTNENPYPPAPQVLEAVRSVDAESLRRYPPPTAAPFRQLAAQVHGLAPQQVIATNGGDELLRLAVTVFCQPAPPAPLRGEPVQTAAGLGMAEPSYSLYPVLAQIQDTPLTRIPLRDDFSLPDNFAEQLNDAGCRLAMIVNPHAPSGRLEPLEQLEKIAKTFRGVLLIDEAYVDFAQQDAVSLLHPEKNLNNVLLLRSFSKGYSLAGVRFGYGLGHHDLIAALDKARDSYNTDILSQAAASAALRHRDQAAKTWRVVIDERARLAHELTQRGFVVYPSQSNFVLAQPHAPAGGTNAQTLYELLKQRDIYVRYFNHDRLSVMLRITVGTPEENQALVQALDDIHKT